jgi:hypothetical protein
VEREYWCSEQLSLNLVSKRSDPRYGVQTFTVSDRILGDPDAELFQVAQGI